MDDQDKSPSFQERLSAFADDERKKAERLAPGPERERWRSEKFAKQLPISTNELLPHSRQHDQAKVPSFSVRRCFSAVTWGGGV